MASLSNRFGAGTRTSSWSEIPICDRDAYLTDFHEHDHFAQLISSPSGILVWRLYQVLSRDVAWLCRKYAECGVSVCTEGRPLVEWYRSQGRAILESAIRGHKKEIAHLQYVDAEVIPGIEGVDNLLQLLTCRQPEKKFKDYTVGKFISLLNFIFPYLSRRCTIPWCQVWKSRKQPNEPLFPHTEQTRSVNLRGLLEVLAYANEKKQLLRTHADHNDLRHWADHRIPNEFKVPLDSFLKIFGDPGNLRGHLSRCLLGRIDLCSFSGIEDEIYVEEEWPWWRCRMEPMRSILLLKNDLISLQNLCARASLYGPNSWEPEQNKLEQMGLAQSRLAQEIISGQLRRLDRAFLRANKARLNSLICFIKGQFTSIYDEAVSELMLIEYQDSFQFRRPTTLVSELIGAVFSGMVICFNSNIARGTSMQPPEPTGRKLADSIAQLGGLLNEEAQFKEVGSSSSKVGELCESVRRLFTREFFQRMPGGTNILWSE